MNEQEKTPDKPASESSDVVQRLVAALIMGVTLLGAVLAFMQAQAGNRSARAARRSETASIQALNLVQDASRRIFRENLAFSLANDHDWFRFSYDLEADAGGLNSTYARALAGSHGEARGDLTQFSTLLRTDDYDLPNANKDFNRFYEELYRSSYEAVEYDKAHAIERDGWGAKTDQYVTVITVLAVALFLLGLSSAIPANARRPFMLMGSGVAAIAALWALTIFIRPVQTPSAEAITAFVDGVVERNHAESREDFDRAAAHFGEAIQERGDYTDAYLGRGNSRFELDMLHPDGPQGSEQARDDFLKALELGQVDATAWGNLGAVQFWLGDYDQALHATRRAVALAPDELVWNLNVAHGLIGVGSEEGFDRQLERIRELIIDMPRWLRDFTMRRHTRAMDLVIEHRPGLADRTTEFLESIKRMHHQINVAQELYGQPEPPDEVDATIDNIAFKLVEDGTVVRVTFDYQDMETGQMWFYRSYLDDQAKALHSIKPRAWEFDVPDGGLVFGLVEPEGFISGQVLRTEIFVEGHLLGAGEFTIP